MAPRLDLVVMDPLLLLGIAAAAIPLLDRVRRADSRPSRWRLAAIAGALLLLCVTFVSPLQTLGAAYLLSAHLVQITLLMGVIPPLLLLGLVPARPRRWPASLRRLGHVLTHPGVAIVLVNLVFFATHAGQVFEAALTHPWGYDLADLALLGASVAFWWPIISPDGRATLVSPLGKLGYILLATIPQTFAGLTLAVNKHVLFDVYAAAPRVLDISPLADQQIAGACLALLSKVALFTAFSIIFARLLDGATDDDDGGGGRRRDPAPEPPGQPAWFLDLQRGRVRPEPTPRRPPARDRVPAGSR